MNPKIDDYLENVQKWREELVALRTILLEAIGLEKAGEKVDFKEEAELAFPEELERKLAVSPALDSAFQDLTPGRQRAYLLHFSAPKQSKTREARIEKCREKILNGKGLQDCHCGLSKRMPRCDGSHKNLC